MMGKIARRLYEKDGNSPAASPIINLIHLHISSVFLLIEFNPLISPQYEARVAAILSPPLTGILPVYVSIIYRNSRHL